MEVKYLVFDQLDVLDNGLVAGVDRTVFIVGLDGIADGIDNFHTFGDNAESGIVAVEELGILVTDEELGRGTRDTRRYSSLAGKPLQPLAHLTKKCK